MTERNVEFKISYDASVDAAYIYFFNQPKDNQLVNTYELDEPPKSLEGEILVDITQDGKLSGIEVLNASKVFPPNFLK